MTIPTKGYANQRDRLDAEGYTEIAEVMSNFDYAIDETLAAELRTRRVYSRHAGWHFNGIVWWDGEQFCEEVWVYRAPCEVIREPDLRTLMETVNNTYGWD
jgi:hypothetical protein